MECFVDDTSFFRPLSTVFQAQDAHCEKFYAQTLTFTSCFRQYPRQMARPGKAMPTNLPDPKEIGHYYALAQVGLEMVMPVVIGLLLEGYFEWRPWGVVVGAVLGLTAGLAHLVAILNRWEQKRSDKSRRGQS
jgi:hypothetical protein